MVPLGIAPPPRRPQPQAAHGHGLVCETHCESRVVRTTAVHVRPGRAPDFEAFMKEAKEAGEKAANAQPLLVSQAVEGSKGTTFYITSLRSSLGGFDKNPTLREILGE